MSQAAPAAMDCEVLDPDLRGKYEGQCDNGLASGRGIAYGRDVYKGEFLAGKPSGRGEYRWSKSGTVYRGEFKDGYPEGSGKYSYGTNSKHDGESYSGTVAKGLPHGKGTYKYKSGDVYSGDFRLGKRNGSGIYRWANGCKYSGEFSEDLMTNEARKKCER
jgi:hypothetical protein